MLNLFQLVPRGTEEELLAALRDRHNHSETALAESAVREGPARGVAPLGRDRAGQPRGGLDLGRPPRFIVYCQLAIPRTKPIGW